MPTAEDLVARVARSRAAQGLPPHIEDAVLLAPIARSLLAPPSQERDRAARQIATLSSDRGSPRDDPAK